MCRLLLLLFICNFLNPSSQFTELDHKIPRKTCEGFKCHSGECILANERCNKVDDCIDGSDEKHCNADDDGVIDFMENFVDHLNSFGQCDPKYEYKCDNNQCIPRDKFCDTIHDCEDSSDEHEGCSVKLNCKDKFKCQDGHCIINEWVCDGASDCPDGSDEWNCNANKTSVNCTLENSQYLCRNQRCIGLNMVCNKNNDCGDMSDEGPGCEYGKPGNCPRLKCDQLCRQTPKGGTCSCKSGYKLLNDNRTCLDIDECQTYGICDQECVNFPGMYKCTCKEGYTLYNKKNCKAIAGDATLAIGTRTEIIGMYLGSHNHHFVLASSLNRSANVALDDDTVYWSDIEGDREAIVRSVSRHKHEVIVTTGLSKISEMAVDWITKNIYFADEDLHHIGVCNNDGTYCTVIINANFYQPKGIALLATAGKMYWGDWAFNQIIVAGMDGKNIYPLVRNLQWPKSVTIDYPNDRLYWVNAKSMTIESVRLDGTDRRLILHDLIKGPTSLAIFENKLYWSDYTTNTVESCDKFTGKDWHILYRVNKEHLLYNIHIDHSAIKPKRDNPCRSNPCSQLCLLSQDKKYTCACTLDKELNADGHTCRDVKEYVLILKRNSFVKYYHQMLGKPKVTNVTADLIAQLIPDPISGQAFAFNWTGSMINIVRYDPVTSNFEDVISLELFRNGGIAYDHIGNNFYTLNEKTIEVHSVKTKAKTVFYFEDTPLFLQLAPEEGKMYVAFSQKVNLLTSIFYTTTFSIYEMQMNGLGERKLLKNNLEGLRIIMYYDKNSKTLFVGDGDHGHILSISVKDTRISHIRTGLAKIQTLTVAGKYIFWTEYDSKALYWTDYTNYLYSRLNHKDVGFHIPIEGPGTPSMITLRKDAKQDHGCQKNNGNCSHVCLFSSNTSYICACPPKMELSNDNHTCVTHHECPKHKYKCGEHSLCIDKEKICDQIRDCPNGEDETADCGKRGKCDQDQFMCKNGHCISSEDYCNNHYDCADLSDELNCPRKCTNDEFQCHNKIDCIPMSKVCNTFSDCPDFSDELISTCKMRTCSNKEFTCDDHTCIPRLFLCDGQHDCINGEDEAPNQCESYMNTSCKDDFRCNNGNCISPSLKCDGVDDCHDGSDERHCSDIDDCSLVEYSCHDSNRCIPLDLKCNGIPDCPKGDDEHSCAFCILDEFACNNARCIPESWVCDKVDDCGDNSDEKHCDGSKGTVEKFNGPCDFNCTLGTCLSYSKVCDGIRDCPDGSDEDGKCHTACRMNNYCKDVCYKTPKGAFCGCQDGYRLAADRISCEDIDECKDGVCSQICTNTLGSYSCSCHDGYVIRKDKFSCKAVGPQMEYIVVTDSDIRKISSDLHIIEVIYELPGLSVTGIDVNAAKRLIYWSDDELGTITKFDLRKMIKLSTTIVNHPQALAVDWSTDNVYVIDKGFPSKIKVCNLEKGHCVTVVTLQHLVIVRSLIVDPINRWVFWAQISRMEYHPTYKIYRTDMMGTNLTIINPKTESNIGIVSGMVIDHVQSKLYWSDTFHKTIESSNLDGTQQRRIVSLQSHPLSISIFEQTIYWVVATENFLQAYKIHNNEPHEVLKIHINNIHRHFSLLQISRQPVVKSLCNEEYCDYICVPSNDNATCLCPDGKPIRLNSSCATNINSELKLTIDRKVENNTRNVSGIFSITIIALLVGILLLCAYYYYQKNGLKLKPAKDFSSSIRFQNPSYDRSDEVEVVLDSMSSDLSPGQHEYVNPIDTKFLNLKDEMKSSESKQKSDQCSEKRHVDGTEKQDSLIYFVPPK